MAHPLNHLVCHALGLVAIAALLGAEPVAARADGLASYDGVYSGMLSPQSATPGCSRTDHSIIIHVRNGEAWTHHHHLAGTVDEDGRLAMQSDDGAVQVSGVIQGAALTGSETRPVSVDKLGGAFVNAGGESCSFAVSASRG